MSTRRRMIDRDEGRAVAPRGQTANTTPQPAAIPARQTMVNPLLGLLRSATNVANAFIQRATGGQGAIAAASRVVTEVTNRAANREANISVSHTNGNVPQVSAPMVVGGQPEEIWEVRNHTNGQGVNLRRNTNSYETSNLQPIGQGLHLLVEPDAVQIRNMLRNTPWLVSAALRLYAHPTDAINFLLGRSVELQSEDLQVLFSDFTSLIIQTNRNGDETTSGSCGGQTCSDTQIMDIYNSLPQGYLFSLPDASEQAGLSYESYLASEQFRSDVIEARTRFLTDLFVGSAEHTNRRDLSNMSDEALAAFMLSMTRLETGATWDARTDSLLNFRSRGQYPGNTYGLNLSYTWTDIAAWSSEIQTLWRLVEGNTRVSGASFGVPNLYMGQYYEAIRALYNIDSSNQALSRHYEVMESQYMAAPLVVSPQLINSDPIFSMEAFGFILNWAGLRQRLENAGSENFPAIRITGDDANYTNPSSVPEAEVSAFALTLTRYSDAVVAGIPNFEALLDSDRLSAMIAAVEGIDNAAQTLGVEVIGGQDFMPYTTEEARRLVTALTSDKAIERQLNQILCASIMLQQVYERAEGSAALAAALSEAGC